MAGLARFSTERKRSLEEHGMPAAAAFCRLGVCRAGWGPELTPSASCCQLDHLVQGHDRKGIIHLSNGTPGSCTQRLISLDALVSSHHSLQDGIVPTSQRPETVRHAICVSRRHAAMSQPRRDLPEVDHRSLRHRRRGGRPHDPYSLGRLRVENGQEVMPLPVPPPSPIPILPYRSLPRPGRASCSSLLLFALLGRRDAPNGRPSWRR